jgi:Flp pilus assembly protein TadG
LPDGVPDWDTGAKNMTLLSKLPSLVKCFGTNQKGNVAIMFALSAVPMFLAAGACIDYARYSANETKLQSALDSAALSAASARDLSNTQRMAVADATFKENLKLGELSTAKGNFKIKAGTVYASSDVSLPTTFMRVGGIDVMQLSAVTEIAIPEDKNAEIALVLDYSGSMEDSIAGGVKYIAMKNAAEKLIDDLKKANPTKVKFGLVPFSHHVYVTLPKPYVLGQTGAGNWTGCTQDRPYPANLSDDTPAGGNDTKWGQVQAPEHAGWGCGGYASHNLRVMPLTNDFTALKNQLDAMTPYAWTHIALGVEFGFHLLSDNAPFTTGVGYSDKKTEKIMIVLTDGAQTEPAFGPGTRDVTQGENNLAALCENAKAKGITMMTVAYDLDDSSTRNRLRNCSTDPAKHFFVATDTAAVASAFDNIRNAITAQVFISK